jgi:hypothetical protein
MMEEEIQTKEISFFVNAEDLNNFDKIRKKKNLSRREYFIELVHQVQNEELDPSLRQHAQEDFLLEDSITSKMAYNYLRINPKASKFIYSKYEKLRPMLMEICNPENPLYLEDVKNKLQGTVEFKNEEKNLEDLREEIRKAKDEYSKLKSEIKEISDEWNEWQDKLEEIEKQKDEINKEAGNLQDPDVLKKIKSFNTSFTALVKSIFDNVKSQDINDVMFQSIKLTQDQKNTLKLLSEQSEEIEKLIEDEDFLSEFKLNEVRQKIKEQIEKEKENAQKEMDGFMVHNPEKIMRSIKTHINNSLDRMEGVKEDASGLRYYNSHEYGTITGELYDAISNIDLLNGQVENKGIWSKIRRD